MRTVSALIVIVLSLNAIAQEQQPKSRAALDAEAKAKRLIDAADAAWVKAVLEAKRALIVDLRSAQKTALTNNQLEDANLISNRIQAVQEEIAELEGKIVKATIDAKGFQSIGKFNKGRYSVTASGQWSTGPHSCNADGVKDGQGLGVLTLEINGNRLPIGSKGSFVIEKDGTEVRLGMYDRVHTDNSGELSVVIKKQ